MGRQSVRVAVLQMRCTADVEQNLIKARDFIRNAAQGGANIVCLPELYRSLYFCQSEDHANFSLAEPITGISFQTFSPLARDLGVVIIVPIFERRAAGLYHNSAFVLDADGTMVGLYRKMHIPDDPLYYEKFYFTPGDTGFCAFETRYAKVAPLICWDQWYPEAARLATLAGGNLLVYPTAIGWHPSEKAEFGARQHEAWQTVQRAHAIANGVFVAVANRVGHEGPAEGGIEFWGGSFICGPFGEMLAKASHDQEEILFADCDLRYVEEVRQHWPFLRDRRIDAYEKITKRFCDQ